MTIYIGGAEPTQHEHSLMAEAELESFCVNELDNAKIKAMDDLGRYWYVTIKATLAPSTDYDKEELAEFEAHFREQHEATAQHAGHVDELTELPEIAREAIRDIAKEGLAALEHEILCDIWRHFKGEDCLSDDLYDRLQRLMEPE